MVLVIAGFYFRGDGGGGGGGVCFASLGFSLPLWFLNSSAKITVVA